MLQLITWAEYFKVKSTKDLKKELKELDRIVNVTECFNAHDLLLLMNTQQELERRTHVTKRV